ncbi:MAG: hypothetical protein ACXABG_02505 [Promethearchaeota archaeon]|jgi:hypothetical protein
MEETEKLDDLNKVLEQRKNELINELNTDNHSEVCFEPDKKMSEFIGDIFYKSMKNLFDVGAKLAKNLTGEFIPEQRDK